MLSSAGYEMVIFFFVLSGFFIRYAQQRKTRTPTSFYINRIVRIYPPYLVSVLLAVGTLTFVARYVPGMLTTAGNHELNSALLQAWNELQHADIKSLIQVFGFLPSSNNVFIGYNIVHWSLLPEALFYLLVPLAFWHVRAYYGASLILYVVGIMIKIFHYDSNGLLDFLLVYNFYFAVGAALYDVVVRTAWLARFQLASGKLLLFMVLLLVCIILLMAILKLRVLSEVAAVLLAVLVTSALLAGRVPRHNMAVRLFHPVGIFSFSLYLYHFPLLVLCESVLVFNTGNLVNYIRYYWLAIPVVVLICYTLYWLTERVSINFFRNL